MDEKLVCILNEMEDFLSIAQMKKLQEVLLKNLSSEAPQSQRQRARTVGCAGRGEPGGLLP
mgnify:CR=1 FL=1